MAIPIALIWAALVRGVLIIVRSPRFSPPQANPSRFESAETVARRFAEGEIDEEEFIRRLAVLPGVAEHKVGAK